MKAILATIIVLLIAVLWFPIAMLLWLHFKLNDKEGGIYG